MNAFRSLARSPRYTLLAITLVALGVGVCTTVFSLFDSLLLRDRTGLADQTRLVDLGRSQNGGRFDNLAFPDYLDFRTDARTLTDIAALKFEPSAAGLLIDREAEPASVQWVTPNFLRVLGTRLVAGRDFSNDGKAVPEIIISHAYWLKRFGGDPRVVGRTIVFNQVNVAVVGVTEPGFTGSSVVTPDFWAPLSLWETVQPGNTLLVSRDNVGFIGLGRLAPGATVAQAQTELAGLARRLELAYPNSNKGRGVLVLPSSRLPGEVGQIAGVFLGLLGTLAGLSLLVACTNIGGLMLARGALRRRELAVRAALGAGRVQLIRLLLGEHLALFTLGAAGGLLAATWLIELFRLAVAHAPLPVTLDVSLSPLGGAFALSAALLSGLACGLGPALSGTRFELLPALRSGEHPASSRFFSPRNLFLTVQLAVSLSLLVTAALLTRTLQRLATADTGYDFTRLESAAFDFSIVNLKDAPATAFRDALIARLGALPQVEAAAWSAHVPLIDNGMGFDDLRLPDAAKDDEIRTDWNLISPDYFATVRLPLVAGRNFSAADTAAAPRVAIVNQTFARRTWPGRDPVGQTLLNSKNQPVTIVGVARDASYRIIGEAPRNFIYCPIAQVPSRRPNLFIRSRDGASLAPVIRETVRQLQPGLPVSSIQRLDAIAATGLLPYRIAGYVAAGAGLLALLLSAIGVYGATLFWASTRTREFGLRMALGATFGQLVGFALRGNFRTLAAAVGAGLLVAFGLTQLASAALTKIPFDPLILGGATVLFTGLVTVAAWLPARRAAKVDPMVALRTE